MDHTPVEPNGGNITCLNEREHLRDAARAHLEDPPVDGKPPNDPDWWCHDDEWGVDKETQTIQPDPQIKMLKEVGEALGRGEEDTSQGHSKRSQRVDGVSGGGTA